MRRALRSLQHYRRDWKDKQGQFAQPVHDWASHGADCGRYFAVASRQTAEEFSSGMQLPSLDKLNPRWAEGWRIHPNRH